jgi:radical SAM protein with 4Fe4S-binding SPASM domain
LFVDADGGIYPCPNHRGPENLLGRVPDDSLESVFPDAERLEELRARSCTAHLTRCAECTFRWWCAGDCRAEAEAVGGPGAPSPHCAQLRQVIPELMWMVGRESSATDDIVDDMRGQL